ncbi:PREDICTED: zinc finger protein Elbow [Dinoponera quadriceps]|uniref:Zinc finger protein Elbow n=1 Tax=Dinoponera quadriceps TaxID=609295 RepID=A0A6P3WWP2_DINQU|nr:PREDICTED: zinc finger protein Elbow [Dinoponera quadriceps]
MLTSNANQYLRPEYLTPLPTTLDAKKSPLALLAQTCSQIGADPPSNKSLLSSLDKSSSNRSSKAAEQSREKSSPVVTVSGPTVETTKTSFKPYESCLGREKACSPDEPRSASSHSGRSRTPGSGGKRCPSNQSAASVRAVTPQQGRRTPNGEVARESPAFRSSAPTSATETTTSSQPTVSPSLQVKPAYSPAGVLAMTDPSIKDLPLGTFKPGVSLPTSTAAYLGYSPGPIDVMASSLMSQHHAVLKNGLVATNPYLGYARLKSGGGAGPADSLMPVCRDPYCTGCQLNSHLLSNSTSTAANGKLPSGAASCPAGCAQCDHKPGASPYGPLAYAHAQLAALAAVSQLPYVCNWIAGDTAYCGKRFATSEELLQHLRSHTSVSTAGGAVADPASAAAAALSLLSPSVGLPPTHPLFARTYPTPPLSPLATARYHPYGKPSPLMPPSLPSLGLPLPPLPPPPTAAGLPAYFSPYSLYGPRLGASSGMHQ